MGQESNDRFEDLKQHSLPNARLYEIDITERVMKKIAVKHTEARVQSRIRPLRFSASVTALLIVILASVSVYAASEYIEIRNRTGEVKIQSRVFEAERKIVKPASENVIKKPYRDRVLAVIKPGQLLAYYVNNDRSKPSIKFLDDTRVYSSYSTYAELAARTSAPIIKEPTDLPAGLTFSYGSVMPLIPSEYDTRTSAEYNRLQKLFQKRVELAPDEDLFIEEAVWTEAERSELVYDNGEMTLHITAMKSIIMMETAFTAEYTQDKLNVGGIEVILASSSEGGFKSYEAFWYDERQDTHYSISASGNVQMTENQFNRIVENIIEG